MMGNRDSSAGPAAESLVPCFPHRLAMIRSKFALPFSTIAATMSSLVLILLVVTPAQPQDPFSPPGDVPLEDAAAELGDLEDLFGRPDVPQEEPGEPAEAGEPEARPDPAVQQLVERGRQNPNFLGDSIASLARVKAWDELDSLLATASDEGLEADVKARVAETVGAALMVRISTQEPIGEAAREFLEECQQAASDQRRDPQRLGEAILQLGSDSVDQRLAAMRTLLGAGEASIEALVEAIASDPQSPGRDDQLRVLARLGPGGPEALRQLVLYGQPPQRTAALSAIARLDPHNAIPDLATTFHAPDSSESEREIAAAALRRALGGVPSRDAALELLENRLQTSMREAARIDNDGKTRTVWSVDAEAGSVAPLDSHEIVAAYRRGYDAAARLLRVGSLPPTLARDALIGDLSYRVLVNPEWGAESDRQRVGQMHAIDVDRISLALQRAVQLSNWPAAIGLLRLIEEDASQEQRDRLLRGGGGDPTPLVRAATAAEPRVRYEAVSAIGRVSVGDTYPGISSVRQTAAEMQSLGERPVAVLVETRMEVSQHLESLLEQLGYDVQLVGSVRSLERILAGGSELSFILAKTRLADATPIEMVDRVRRRSIGQEVPIAFFGEPIDRWEEDRWDTPTMRIAEPVTTAGFRPLLDAIELRRRLPPLTGTDRYLYREQASHAF